MSRERLMAQQRARMEERRKRLAEQKKKEQAKAKAKKRNPLLLRVVRCFLVKHLRRVLLL